MVPFGVKLWAVSNVGALIEGDGYCNQLTMLFPQKGRGFLRSRVPYSTSVPIRLLSRADKDLYAHPHARDAHA
jgi:hypothetical protein